MSVGEVIGFWAASVFFGFGTLRLLIRALLMNSMYVYVSITHVVFVRTEDV